MTEMTCFQLCSRYTNLRSNKPKSLCSGNMALIAKKEGCFVSLFTPFRTFSYWHFFFHGRIREIFNVMCHPFVHNLVNQVIDSALCKTLKHECIILPPVYEGMKIPVIN